MEDNLLKQISIMEDDLLMNNKELVTSFYLAKFALQVLDNAVDRCDSKIVVSTAAEVERYAQKALYEREINEQMYALRIRNVLDAASERFQKNCVCNKK